MAKSDIMEMIVELFLIGSVGVSGLVFLATANVTGLSAAVVTILTVVVPLMFGVVIIYKWYSRIRG